MRNSRLVGGRCHSQPDPYVCDSEVSARLYKQIAGYCVRLGIHTYVGQVIGREADLKRDLCQRIQEVRLRDIRHLSVIAQPPAHTQILMKRIEIGSRLLLGCYWQLDADRSQCGHNAHRTNTAASESLQQKVPAQADFMQQKSVKQMAESFG